MAARVLVAEDDAEMRDLVAGLLRAGGYDVTVARDGSEMVRELFEAAVRRFPRDPFDVIVTDLLMPGCTGLEAIARLRGIGFVTPAIVITAFPDDSVQRRADRLDVVLVSKPFALKDFEAAVERALLGSPSFTDEAPGP